jgi:hypothetical protein
MQRRGNRYAWTLPFSPAISRSEAEIVSRCRLENTGSGQKTIAVIA